MLTAFMTTLAQQGVQIGATAEQVASTSPFPNGWFATGDQLLLGALTGFVFGYLLQKAHVTRADVILGQFLLRDFTVARVMLTAIIIGGAGIYAMRSMGMDVPLHVKNAAVWGNLVGGLIFGVGMAILGYCPGTGAAALGDGARDAIWGVLGMLFGAAVFAEVYPWFNDTLLKPIDLGKVTLADETPITVWTYFSLLTGAGLGLFWWLKGWEQRRRSTPTDTGIPPADIDD